MEKNSIIHRLKYLCDMVEEVAEDYGEDFSHIISQIDWVKAEANRLVRIEEDAKCIDGFSSEIKSKFTSINRSTRSVSDEQSFLDHLNKWGK